MSSQSPERRPNRLTIGLLAVLALVIGGVGGINFASAEVSSGDRPVFIPIAPCRLVDTRAEQNIGPKVGPFGADETVTFAAHGANGECTGASGIPTDAVGLSLNVTPIRPTERTFLTLWGSGEDPGTSNLNPAPGLPPTPNAVNTPLSDTGSFNVRNRAGQVHVAIDVNGYYATHNHDDRYVRLDQVPSGSTGFRAIGTVVTASGASTLTGTSAPDGVSLGIIRNGMGDYTLSLTGLDQALTAVVMLTAFGDATDDEARVCSLGEVTSAATSYVVDIDCFGPNPATDIDISPEDASFQFLVLG